MSDYLWDKTGEADEEVERLEELLGGLRFQPRTFEVPTTLPFAPRRATPARAPFNRARLAVAASLVAALLLGAWLITSKQGTANAPQVALSQPATEEKTTQQKPTDQEAAISTPAARDNGVATPPRNDGRDGANRVAAPNVNRHQREFVNVAKRSAEPPRHSSVRDLNAPGGELATGVTPQEREAMEKFVLAMKVTSEKLGYAEREVAGMNRDTLRR